MVFSDLIGTHLSTNGPLCHFLIQSLGRFVEIPGRCYWSTVKPIDLLLTRVRLFRLLRCLVLVSFVCEIPGGA